MGESAIPAIGEHEMDRFQQLKTFVRQFGLTQALPYWVASKANWWLNPYASESYGQAGADRTLAHILHSVDRGFYVDVGCFHPMRFSNTFRFYKQGWHGLNIDANPTLIDECRDRRPEDTSICAAISNREDTREFYVSENPEVSTMSEEHLEQHGDGGLRATRTVQTKTLDSVLSKHRIPDDFHLLDIDVEGNNYEALRSVNLSDYRPWVICIEMIDFEMEKSHPIAEYLLARNYRFVGYSVYNGYFVHQGAPIEVV
jgi:FkbM family methyltransferase